MNKDIDNTEQLGSINRKIVADGENLPAVKLKDGSRVQTGTVATMLHNISLYNAGERGEVERELELAVPTLIKVGSNTGRKFIGECAIAYLAKQN